MESHQTRQGGRLKRAAPLVVIAAGIALLIFAVVFHRLELVIPADAALEAPQGVFLPDVHRDLPERLETPSPAETGDAEPKVVIVTENDIIRESTRGGVALNEDGAVQRTWTDEPPEACPT